MKYMEFWYHNIKNSSYELLQIDGLQLNIWVKSCLDLILIKMCKPLLRCHLYLTICVPSLFYTLLHSTTRILKFWLHDILCFCHVLSNKWGVFRVAPMSCFWMLHEKIERFLRVLRAWWSAGRSTPSQSAGFFTPSATNKIYFQTN
jgi:hypothetical protein